MKTSTHLILFILVVLASLLVGFLVAHVVLSIANLYSISVITQFSFIQIYGLWTIINILSYKYKEVTIKDRESPYKDAFYKLLSTAFYCLIFWGHAFLIFSILE